MNKNKKRLNFAQVIVLLATMLTISACSGGNKPTTPQGEVPNPTSGATGGTSSAIAPISVGEALVSGKPTLAEFSSDTCVYCKQMKLILEEVAKEYQGKLNIVIINVYEEPDIAGNYGIMAIPTQIFFDSSGNIVTKHVGLLPKEDVVAQLKKMGIE